MATSRRRRQGKRADGESVSSGGGREDGDRSRQRRRVYPNARRKSKDRRGRAKEGIIPALRARPRKPGAGRAAEPHGPARPPDFAERERSAPPVGHAGRSFGPRPSPGHEPGLRPDTKEHESHYPARTSRLRGPQKPLCWA